MSAKEGIGIPELLEAIVARVPPPTGDADAPLRALIFDSYYDRYRGAIPSVRVVDGAIREGHGDHLRRASGATSTKWTRSATSSCGQVPTDAARAGRGRLRRGERALGERDARAATRSSTRTNRAAEPLPGYQDVQSMVFAGIYPTDTQQYETLRDALEKLQLNDAVAPLRAGDVHRARLRLPLRLPRPAAHGDRAGAARARVRPRPRHDGAEVEYHVYRTDGDDGAARESRANLPDPRRDRPDRGAVREGAHHGAGRLHRRRS